MREIDGPIARIAACTKTSGTPSLRRSSSSLSASSCTGRSGGGSGRENGNDKGDEGCEGERRTAIGRMGETGKWVEGCREAGNCSGIGKGTPEPGKAHYRRSCEKSRAFDPGRGALSGEVK